MSTEARSQYRSRPRNRSAMTPATITVRHARSWTCDVSRRSAGKVANVTEAPGTRRVVDQAVPVEVGTRGDMRMARRVRACGLVDAVPANGVCRRDVTGG